IFVGYPKETMGYYFYFPPENKVIVARYRNFLERDLISQKFSGRDNDLEDDHMDTLPFQNTSKIPVESESLGSPPELIHVHRAIRILIAIVAYYDYEIWQMDVKTAFLNGRLDEDIYIEQPEGYVDPKYPNRVCKLQRSIYGLKQASRQWNKRFDEEIKKFG
nr:retrotransposon protein, putative, Ty1-copia subclass [Tanacetum cinerariifolium]